LHPDDDQTTAWCDAMAALLTLPIGAGDLASIHANLRFIATQIELVANFPLDDTVEPAAIFRA
jgi:hypothetical protein